MVQVRLEPWKEIVFHDAQQLDLKELTRLQAMSNELAQTMAPLSWVDGIVYATMPMLESEELAAEQLHGRIHFASILFSFMPAYAETIRSGRVDIPIVHLGYNTVSRALASWIKGNFKAKANETGKGT